MDTQVADILIGSLVDGRYRVRTLVARGGMATVYSAVDERLERTIALKIIHPGQANDPRFIDRFTHEAKTIARLTHPNVVAVYDQGNHQGLPYLVMEYVRGRTLRDMLTDIHRLQPIEALAILEQMLAAIAAAHRAGLVHRDVKPENVLIAEAPGTTNLIDAVVKVADFGLARAVEASADDGDGQLLATVAYVAPELVTDGHADPRADVYSTGIVLFEMLTGRVPYDAGRPVDIAWRHVDEDVPRPSKYVPGLPSALDDLVRRATRRTPDERPTDAGAMLAEVVIARDLLEAAGSPSSESLTAPTVLVDSLSSRHAADRPSWARLPGRDDNTRLEGTYRPGAPRRRPSPRPVRGTAHTSRRIADPVLTWFAHVMSRPNGRRVFYSTLGVLALLIVAGGWWFGAGRYTSAPDLVGQTQAQAAATAKKLGFTIKYDDGVFEEKIPKNTVIKQAPPPSASIVRGSVITLSLSKGPERYPVPDETGKPYAIAVGDLESIKLVAKRVDAYSDTLPADIVISMSPKIGQTVRPGAVITLTVSKGKAPITVPNVLTEDINTATAQLTALGLTVAQTQKAGDQPAGFVIAQSIPAGDGAVKGASIILTVSSGPPQVQVPDVSNKGYSFDQAAQILQQSGLVADKIQFLGLGSQVKKQSPAPGATVPPGTHVTLWVYP